MDISSPARNAKNLRVGLEQNFDEGRGRLCGLPDVVLHRILSFLPTKEAVKTSVLSKRWQFVWTSITKLDFHEPLYKFNDNERAKRRGNFMNFVERALLLRESSNIEKFELCCEVLSDESRINSWLSAAVRHKVQRLILKFPHEFEEKSFMLPHCIFSCESLKELDIELPYVLNLPSYICFSSLKILSLKNIRFPNDHSAQQLFSACPYLMKLDLSDCSWKNVNAVHISAPMLKDVIISENACYGDDSPCQIMISGMNLQSFSYMGELKIDICIVDAPSLDKATFDVPGIEHIANEERMRIAAYRAFKLLVGLANVKSLEVSPGCLQLLASAEELLSHLPSLYNLKDLVVGDYDEPLDFACKGLMKMLQNSPHLETINFISKIKLSAYHENHEWTIDPVPPCFLTNLWSVRFRFFDASDEELHVVKTLLTIATALGEISLLSQVVNKIDDLLPLRSKNPIKVDCF